MNVFDIIIYVIVIYILIFAFKSERVDLYCPEKISKTSYNCKDCGDGKGKYYVDGKLLSTDTISTGLDKIELLSDYNESTVKWRRCIMLSVIIVVLSNIIICRSIPSGDKLLMYILICFIILYNSYGYYAFHYDRYPMLYIKENVEAIRTKLNLKRGKMKLII